MLNPPLYPRSIEFEAILNFRDLGGYQTANNRSVAWRRVFRSGELRYACAEDIVKLKCELGIKSILDLRHKGELNQYGMGPLLPAGFNYHNVPLVIDPDDPSVPVEKLNEYDDLGELYLFFIRHPNYGQGIVQCLSVIAESASHHVVFHCSAGKDRTGVVAAILLSVLGVGDEDIAADYSLTGEHILKHLARSHSDPETSKFLDSLPDYIHLSIPGSMQSFLSAMRREYGSVRAYLRKHGAAESLFVDLEKAILV